MSESGSEYVGYSVQEKVAWARIDHGKANALSFEVLEALGTCLTLAEQDPAVGALVVTGKPGFLTGGFDLSVMKGEDPTAVIRLVSDGGALFTRIFASPLPVVVAASGHAVAAGALMLLAADERIGVDGSFQIGLIETKIGMFLPRWAIELAEERLSRRHFQVATVGARMYPPAGARDAGYLDTVVGADALEEAAQAAAATLGRAAGAGLRVAGPRDPRRPGRGARGRRRRRPRCRGLRTCPESARLSVLVPARRVPGLMRTPRRSRTARLALLAVVALVAAACVPRPNFDPPVGPRAELAHSGRWLTDHWGRVVNLHGVNYVKKFPPIAAGGGRLRCRRRAVPPRRGLQRGPPRRGVRRGDARARRDRPGLRRLDRRDRARPRQGADLHPARLPPGRLRTRSPTATASPSGPPSPTACPTRRTRSRPTTSPTPRCSARSTTSGTTCRVPTVSRSRPTTRRRCGRSRRRWPGRTTCSATTS